MRLHITPNSRSQFTGVNFSTGTPELMAEWAERMGGLDASECAIARQFLDYRVTIGRVG